MSGSGRYDRNIIPPSFIGGQQQQLQPAQLRRDNHTGANTAGSGWTNWEHYNEANGPYTGTYPYQHGPPMPVAMQMHQQPPMYQPHHPSLMVAHHPPPPPYHPHPMIPPPPPPPHLDPRSGQRDRQPRGLYQNASSYQAHQQDQGLAGMSHPKSFLQPQTYTASRMHQSEQSVRGDVTRKDSVMDVSISNKDTEKQVAKEESMSSILKKRILQLRETSANGISPPPSVALHTLATIAHCHDTKHFPENENVLQQLIKRANTAITSDPKPPGWKLIDGLLRSNTLLETGHDGFIWHHDKISKVLASIKTTSDLKTILDPSQPPEKPKPQKPASAGNSREKTQKKILDMLLFWEKEKKWPKDTTKMREFLDKHPKFWPFPPGTIKARGMIVKQSMEMERSLKRDKFLVINPDKTFVWNYLIINDALAREGMKQVENPLQNKNITNIIGTTDDSLHKHVVKLFNDFRTNGFWPWTSNEFEDILASSPIMSLVSENGNVGTARSEILHRVLLRHGYVLNGNIAPFTWQMDAIEGGFLRFQHASFDNFARDMVINEKHKQVLASFRSCYERLCWPRKVDTLMSHLVSQKVLPTLGQQEVFSGVLLPFGYISIGGGAVTYHYKRIHRAFGMPERGKQDQVLEMVASNMQALQRNRSTTTTVAAACMCYKIFMTMDWWPKKRSELKDFLKLETDEAIERFVNIHPKWDVEARVIDMLEPLFTEAKLLEVNYASAPNDPPYNWLANNKPKVVAAKLIDSTNDGQALEQNIEQSLTQPGLTTRNETEQCTQAFLPPPTGTTDNPSDTSQMKRPASFLVADPKKKQRVDGLDLAGINSVGSNETGSGGLSRDELVAKRAAAKKSLSEALERAKMRHVLEGSKQSVHRFSQLAKGLHDVTALSRKLIICRGDPHDSSRLYFAPEINVDDIILKDDMLGVKVEAVDDSQGSMGTLEPKSVSVKDECMDMEIVTSAVGASTVQKKSTSHNRRKEVQKMHTITRMAKLLVEQETLLVQEKQEVAKYSDQLETCTKAMSSTHTTIKAYNYRISDMEKDAAELEEMIAERVLLITRKRQELQLYK